MPRLGDVVELCRLEGDGWVGMNRRIGVIEELRHSTVKVVLTSETDVVVPKNNIIPMGINVSIGAAICVEGLTSPDWSHVNNQIGRVLKAIDNLGKITCSFPNYSTGIAIMLRNLRQADDVGNESSKSLTMMLKKGTLVEIFGLKDPSFADMNGILGVVASGKVRFEGGTAGRVPVAVDGVCVSFLPRNIRPAKNAKYLEIKIDPSDVTQGIQFTNDYFPLVQSVKKRSSSCFAGIKPGDIIFAVAAEVTSSPSDIWKVFLSLADGQQCCIITVAGSQPRLVSHSTSERLRHISSPHFV